MRANREWLEELLDLGAQATPVTIVERDDGERTIVMGFDKARLSSAIGE